MLEKSSLQKSLLRGVSTQLHRIIFKPEFYILFTI